MQNDDTLTVAIIALAGTALSLAGTVFLAYISVHNTQVNASDEIATGSSKMLSEYRIEQQRLKDEIENIKKKCENEIAFLRQENILLRARIIELENKLNTGPFI